MHTGRDSFAPQERIRVLVVDGSSLVRRLLARIFERDATTQVVGSACNGFEALAKIPLLRPHVVVLDAELPEMNGLQTRRSIAKSHPAIRVVTLTTLDTHSTAGDCLTKPAQATESAYEVLAADLLAWVKACVPQSAPHASADAAAALNAPRTPTPIHATSAAPEVCAIGVSTGGPGALFAMWSMLPRNFPLPIVIVQHMPAMFTQMLAERLNRAGAVTVVEGTDGMVLGRGQAVIAPGGFHMRIARAGRDLVIRLDQGPKVNSCRPAVDVLFRSIAEVLGGRAIAVVLTGMGQDGLAGARLLKEKGATVFAQDEATSAVWGMPGAIAAANLADAVLPLDRIVAEVMRRIRDR